MATNSSKSVEDINPPEEFHKIINDFIIDIINTFPEYTDLIRKWWNITDNTANTPEDTIMVFRFCVKSFPERFFDILYKNAEMFDEQSVVNTEFLPGIVFKHLWNSDISDNTKDTIWKYLQIILFAVIGSVHSSADFGDSAKMFESINEDELKQKLEDTLENMQKIFDTKDTSPDNNPDSETGATGINMENIPNADQIHSHINNMMQGNLGKLAFELAEDAAKDLDFDMDATTDPQTVYKKLFQNPSTMMNMVKNIGSKIDTKLKSGEIKESELMSEGMELLNKMKDMPGMGDMQQMFSQMGMPGLGKGSKMNMGAMGAKLNANMKNAQMKERMKTKAELNEKMRAEQTHSTAIVPSQPMISEEEIIKIFSTGEIVEKTPRGTSNTSSNKKKTNKKKKKK